MTRTNAAQDCATALSLFKSTKRFGGTLYIDGISECQRNGRV